MRFAWTILAAALAGCGASTEGERAPPYVRSCWGGLGRTHGLFYKPRAIAAAADRLYVADMTGRIQVFDLDGGWRGSWRLPDVSRGYPTGLGVRPDGCIAVADTHNYVVRMYSPNGEPKKTIGREGGGPGEFTYLTDVEFDRAGNMYVSEHGREDRIQKFDAEGRFITSWGRSGEAPGEFHRPQALAVDETGAVYVADAANHRVQKFSGQGDLLAVWGGPGREPGQLLYPYDLAIAGRGLLLVCEYGNNRIQAFDRNGRSAGVWGNAGRRPGQLATPWAVTWVAGRGTYVVDTGNHRIQMWGVSGEGE